MSNLVASGFNAVDWAERYREFVETSGQPPMTIEDALTAMEVHDLVVRDLAKKAVRYSLGPDGRNHDLTEQKKWLRERERAAWALELPDGQSKLPFTPTNSIVDRHLDSYIGDENMAAGTVSSVRTLAGALTQTTNKKLKAGDVEVMAQQVDNILRDAKVAKTQAEAEMKTLSVTIDGQKETMDAKDKTIAALEMAMQAQQHALEAMRSENLLLRERLGIELPAATGTAVSARHNA